MPVACSSPFHDAGIVSWHMRRLVRCVVVAGTISAALASVSAAAGAADRARAEPVPVQLLSITDLHGYLHPTTPAEGGEITGPDGERITVGGAGYLATHLNRLRADQPNSLLVGAGDQFAGWPYYVDAHQDEPTIEVLNAFGLDVNAVGNHELDVSPSFLIDHMGNGECFGEIGLDSCFTDSTGERFHGADFDSVSANVVEKANEQPIVPPYVVRQVEGTDGERLPVGIIGITVPGTEVGSTSFQPDLKTLGTVATVNTYVKELRNKGVQAIVLNVHDGATQSAGGSYNECNEPSGPLVDIAERVSPEVDAIVGGHWHTLLNCMLPDPNGVPRPVVEAGAHGQAINEIQLSLDPGTGDVLRDQTTARNVPNTRDVEPDPDVQSIVDHWIARGEQRSARPVAEITGDFTRTPNDAGESTMGDLAADVQYWAAEQTEAGKADLALVSTDPHEGSNAVRRDLLVANSGEPGDADGRVLDGEAWHTYGYGNPVLTVTVTGEQIHQALEEQWKVVDSAEHFAPFGVSANVSYAFDPAAPIGDRVDPADMLIDNTSLELGKDYRLAALAYTVIGGDGVTAFEGYRSPYRNQPADHEVFVDYLEAKGTLAPAPLDRVRVRSRSPA